MKKVLLALCIVVGIIVIAVTGFLMWSSNLEDPIPTGPSTSIGTTAGAPAAALPAMADLLANWAWGASNGNGDGPATHLVVTGYPAGADFNRLDLAVGAFGQAKVGYAGEKKGDDSIEPWYFANYKRVTGPYFAFAASTPVLGWDPIFLLDSSVLGEGLARLLNQYDVDSYSYPPARAADIAIAEALHPGRRVLESQLLAVADDGVRVCMFRYENVDGEGLFSIVCFDGEKALAIDYTTEYVEDDGAHWRVDLEPDVVGLLEPVLLCRTQEGILLLVAWSAPEGMAELILREKGGALEAFSPADAVYFYDPWGNTFYLEDINADLED